MRSSLFLAGIFLAGCGTVAGTPPRGFAELGPGPAFALGGLTVLVGTPEEIRVVCKEAGVIEPEGRRVLGCFSRRAQMIVTPPDFWILLHEFKHVLEPGWKHE